jgi:hypothetical protein
MRFQPLNSVNHSSLICLWTIKKLTCQNEFEPFLRGHMSCKATFSLSQRWPLNILQNHPFKRGHPSYKNHFSIYYCAVKFCSLLLEKSDLFRKIVSHHKKHGYVLLYWKRFKYMSAVIKKYLPLDKLDEVPASELCEPFFSNFLRKVVIFSRFLFVFCVQTSHLNYLWASAENEIF